MPNDNPPDLAILSAANHPEHAAWQRGEPAAVAKVEAAFKAKYGESSSEPAASDTPLDPELEKIKAQYEGDAGEPLDIAAEKYRVEQELRQAWGEDYQVNVDVCMGVAKELFGDDTDLLLRVAGAIGDDVKAMDMLLKLARGRQ